MRAWKRIDREGSARLEVSLQGWERVDELRTRVPLMVQRVRRGCAESGEGIGQGREERRGNGEEQEGQERPGHHHPAKILGAILLRIGYLIRG